MYQHFFCKPHSELVKYVGQDDNNQIEGFCLNCVPKDKGPLELVEEVVKNVESKKTTLQEFIQKQQFKNLCILDKLLQNLTEFRNSITGTIDAISSEIIFIKKSNKSIMEQINSYTTYRLNDLIQFFKISMNESQIRELKKELFEKIQKITQEKLLKDAYQANYIKHIIINCKQLKFYLKNQMQSSW